jgi:hypothetical protein
MNSLVETSFSFSGQEIQSSSILVPLRIRKSPKTCFRYQIPDIGDIQRDVEVVAISHIDAPMAIVSVMEDREDSIGAMRIRGTEPARLIAEDR